MLYIRFEVSSKIYQDCIYYTFFPLNHVDKKCKLLQIGQYLAGLWQKNVCFQVLGHRSHKILNTYKTVADGNFCGGSNIPKFH